LSEELCGTGDLVLAPALDSVAAAPVPAFNSLLAVIALPRCVPRPTTSPASRDSSVPSLLAAL